MVVLLCVLLFATAHAQYLPLSAPLPQVVSPCSPTITPQQVVTPCQSPVVSSSPVVATTVVDNSVSNALANALQLLIVSNLIENTMNSPCGLNAVQSAVSPFCDAIPVQASVYSPAIDVLTPDYLPYSYDAISVSPCDIITPCDPIIDVIPNNYYPEVLSVPAVSCGCDAFVPNVGPNYGCSCGYDSPFIPNIGPNFPCGCDSPFMPNIGPNFGCGCGYDNPFAPNFGPSCGCGGFPSLQSLLPSLLPGLGLPNLGCGCNNFGFDANPFGCDQCGGIGPEVLYNAAVPSSCGCGYGAPGYPVGVNMGIMEPCPNSYYGGGYYF